MIQGDKRSFLLVGREPWVVLGLATFAIHLIFNAGYGIFRDELYFIIGGDRPAWGYVDQPSLIPLLASWSHALFGNFLVGFRLIPSLALSATVALSAAIDIFPDDPPLFLARTPHGYHEKEVIIADVQSAGFAKAAAETLTRRSVALSCRDPAIGFCQGTPLRNEIEARDASMLIEATDAAAAKISARFGNGPVDGMIQAHVITAR